MPGNSYTDPTWIKAGPRADAEPQVGDVDPLGRPDVLNRADKSLTAWVRRLLMSMSTGGTIDLSAAVTSILPVSWLQSTPGLLVPGSVALPEGRLVQPAPSGPRHVRAVSGPAVTPVGVTLHGVSASGAVAAGQVGMMRLEAAGPIARGNYVRPALSPVGAVVDAGVPVGGTAIPPVGSVGVAATGTAEEEPDGELIWAYCWGHGYHTGEPAQSLAQTYLEAFALDAGLLPVDDLAVTVGMRAGARLGISFAARAQISGQRVFPRILIDNTLVNSPLVSINTPICYTFMSEAQTAGDHHVMLELARVGGATINLEHLVFTVRELAI